jgi:ethanolamine utilization cobalamin adenosyltransferase
MQGHYGVNSSLTRARAQRLVEIIDDVRMRLRLICAEMPAPLFNEMVECIALVQLKYEKDLFLGGRHWT